MRKIDLTDVTFIIPVRIDSTERLENLRSVIGFIKTHFVTTIVVLEADSEEHVDDGLIDKKIFVKDLDPVFHRTKYLNQLTKLSTTPILAIWDTDVIVGKGQIVDSVTQIRNKRADMVFPYDGRFFNCTKELSLQYVKSNEIHVFEENQEQLWLVAGNNSVGGAFIVRKSAYVDAGMENEFFFGWGPEDVERVKRLEILEFLIKRVEGPLYHLYHPRLSNSSFQNNERLVLLNQEFIRMCRFDKDGLKKEIEKWDWIKDQY